MTNLSFLTVSIVCSSQKSSFSPCSMRYAGKMRYLLLLMKQEIFSNLHSTQSHFSMQTRALFPGAKWQSTVDCSHPWSAKVKEMWSYISTPHTASCGGAQLSTDSYTTHIIKFLYLQNYPRLVCDVLITTFHHKIHTLLPPKITWLHDLCRDLKKHYVKENIIPLDLCVYVEQWVGPTLTDIILKQYTCLSLNPFMCLFHFMCISHYKSSLHTF